MKIVILSDEKRARQSKLVRESDGERVRKRQGGKCIIIQNEVDSDLNIKMDSEFILYNINTRKNILKSAAVRKIKILVHHHHIVYCFPYVMNI